MEEITIAIKSFLQSDNIILVIVGILALFGIGSYSYNKFKK